MAKSEGKKAVGKKAAPKKAAKPAELKEDPKPLTDEAPEVKDEPKADEPKDEPKGYVCGDKALTKHVGSGVYSPGERIKKEHFGESFENLVKIGRIKAL